MRIDSCHKGDAQREVYTECVSFIHKKINKAMLLPVLLGITYCCSGTNENCNLDTCKTEQIFLYSYRNTYINKHVNLIFSFYFK